MSYSLKAVETKEYSMLGIKKFKEAQDEALIAAAVAKADILIINEDNNDILAVAVYYQADDIRLILSTSGLTDSPWIC